MIGERKMKPNTVFYGSLDMPLCNGWLPEGYTAAVSAADCDTDNNDMPLIIWLAAANGEGKKLQCNEICFGSEL